MEPMKIRVITDLRETDGTFEHARPVLDPTGALLIRCNGTDVAWYGPHQWIKVEFGEQPYEG